MKTLVGWGRRDEGLLLALEEKLKKKTTQVSIPGSGKELVFHFTFFLFGLRQGIHPRLHSIKEGEEG